MIDFVEISPDTLCDQSESGVLQLNDTLLQRAHVATAHLPGVVHGIGLSIGSACGWNESYIAMLDEFARSKPMDWHSEHLGFLHAADATGAIVQAGIPLPLPFTSEAADLVSGRARWLQSRYGVPFLLENAVHYLPELVADEGWDEVRFLNEIVARSGCGLLLDLFNLFCNASNFGFSPFDAVRRLPLDYVVEVHLAGGAVHDGFLLDSHSAIVPDPVWELLDYVLPRTPALRGVVFEVIGEAFADVGVEATRAQLRRARRACQRHCQADGAAAA